ncbi:hypothetical protein M2168_003435 [Streptomyces sp. CZ24]|nr:hypothetical protein [Streptomyces sp. CZ24]
MITAGWPVKSWAEATNPVTFTTRATRSRSPATDFTAARAFSAQTRARSLASSGVTSAPTLPVSGSAPSTMGSWPEVNTYTPEVTAGWYEASGGTTSGRVSPSSTMRASTALTPSRA